MKFWACGRVAYGAVLERRFARKSDAGSNPAMPASWFNGATPSPALALAESCGLSSTVLWVATSGSLMELCDQSTHGRSRVSRLGLGRLCLLFLALNVVEHAMPCHPSSPRMDTTVARSEIHLSSAMSAPNAMLGSRKLLVRSRPKLHQEVVSQRECEVNCERRISRMGS